MSKGKGDDFEKGMREITRALCDLDPDEIYAAGKAEGRRLERRALRLWSYGRYVDANELRMKLAVRSKRKGK